MNSSDKTKPLFFDDFDLNQDRIDIRTDKKESITKGEFYAIAYQEFQILNNIPEINQEMMINVWNFIQDNSNYINFIAKIFPYKLYFQIVLESPHKIVKTLALTHLSNLSEFPSFPFDELINSPCFLYLLEKLKQSKQRATLSPIINILTYLLKTHPECRDSLIEAEVLNTLSEKLVSQKIPAFLETILTITPSLQPELISSIKELYDYLLGKKIDYRNNFEVRLIQNTIYSLIHLLKQEFSPFDFSFIVNHVDHLLDSEDLKIVQKTARMIGYLPFPTIQYEQRCIDKITKNRDINIIHTLLKVFIRKHDEWQNSQDLIIESCLSIANDEYTSFNDSFLCLKVLFLYFPFNQIYDSRVLDLLIKFLNFSDISLQCIEKIIIMFEKTESDDEERQSFISKVSESIDEFQTVIEEDNNEDASHLINELLSEIDKASK